ncbi:response regulator transcription factor [Marinicella sediminis]|uniref:Response regulator transcription factor n=1 Tax=Marinicella sediminis TaxID=1792834 RepID=A0ABV7JGG4_9GAMM|nr:response regulator transcription factor [Marinicella sediminis]
MTFSFHIHQHQPSDNNRSGEDSQVPAKHILVIEDEVDIAQLIHIHLSEVCQQVQLVHDGEQGLKMALQKHWDVIILDLRLPKIDGLEICRQIRNQNQYVPILMLTAKSTELDRVLGLELGADDYLTKPFSVIELTARVKALLRRFAASQGNQQPSANRPLSFSGLDIDADRRQVHVHGKEVRLTAKEFDLLWFFASHPDKVFNRNQLLDQVWGYGHDGYEHTVNSHMNRLRTKIERDSAHPRYIKTIWGVGYQFIASQSAGSQP